MSLLKIMIGLTDAQMMIISLETTLCMPLFFGSLISTQVYIHVTYQNIAHLFPFCL